MTSVVISYYDIWASLWDYGTYRIGDQRWLRRVCVVSLEPSLFAHMNYGSGRRVRSKIRHLSIKNQTSMTAHAYLSEFKEDKKCQNLMSWLIYSRKKVAKCFRTPKLLLFAKKLSQEHHFSLRTRELQGPLRVFDKMSSGFWLTANDNPVSGYVWGIWL